MYNNDNNDSNKVHDMNLYLFEPAKKFPLSKIRSTKTTSPI